MPAIITCINHPHQPSASPLINLHKETWPLPVATLARSGLVHSSTTPNKTVKLLLPYMHGWDKEMRKLLILVSSNIKNLSSKV